MTNDEALDCICANLALESWFEGKTLTIAVWDDEIQANKFVKLRLDRITDKPSVADLRGEPE